MTVYLIKKEKNKIYKSESIVAALFQYELSHTEKGAPILENLSLNISISDTKNYWSCAFSEKTVGIDIEEINRTVVPSVVNKLHKKEKEYLEVLSFGSKEWTEEFLSIWTKKEAYSKYLGTGLASGFSKFCVLEDFSDSLETKIYTKKYGNIIISATEEFDIEKISYNAPMNKTALEAGADILDMFGCSANTLKEKLLGRGYSEEDAKSAVDTLLERGYLNDEEYARSISNKLLAKGYSANRIAFELKKKGVEEAFAKDYTETFKAGDYARAMEIAEKMASPKLSSKANDYQGTETESTDNSSESIQIDDKLKAKIARKLASLGYESSIVYDIILRLK